MIKPLERMQGNDAKAFFQQIDLFTAGLEQVRACVDRQNYEQALQTYRAYLKEKWNKYDIAPPKGNPETAVMEADLLLENKVSLLGGPLYDIGNPIDWFAAPGGDPQWQSHLGYMYFQNCLVHAYLQTKKKIYLDKWCEILTDFIANHSLGVRGLAYNPTYPMYLHEDDFGCGGEGRYPNYAGGTWIGLACSSRVENWITGLKYLIGEDDLPTSILCNILVSIMTDHNYIMTTNPRRYVPNQFVHVAMSLTMTGIVFHEFKAAASCYLTGIQRVEQAIHECVLPDGSDFEQSFNYNKSIPNQFYTLLRLYDDRPARRILALLGKVKQRCRFLTYITNPLKQWPDIAKGHSSDETPLLQRWSDQYDLPDIKQAITQLDGAKIENASLINSVAFPAGGYYVMRSGWHSQSLYMLLKTSRLAEGHMHEDCNSLTLTAYGRNMLIDSGHYNYSSDEQSTKINHYFYSSMSHNTIYVDEMSQRRMPLQKRGSTANVLKLQEPIHTRWHSSSRFDLAEGQYEDGYGRQNFVSGDNSLEGPIMDVKHERQVAFLKNDLWIVTDRLRGEGVHHYSLAWQLAPEYLPDQLCLDEDNKSIQTNDPAGPNLFIRHFLAKPVEFGMKYGESEPYAGWYASGYNKMIESMDIRTTWEGDSDQIIISLLYPTQGREDNMTQITDLHPSDHSAGFEMILKDGRKFQYAANINEDEIELGPIRMRGEALLLKYEAGGQLSGMALGCRMMSIQGRKELAQEYEDFEFEIENDRLKLIIPIVRT